MARGKGADGIRTRIREFFEDNPGEVLTYDDAAVKFGCTREQALRAVEYLRAAGEVCTRVVVMSKGARDGDE
jgi:hypothetical protein